MRDNLDVTSATSGSRGGISPQRQLTEAAVVPDVLLWPYPVLASDIVVRATYQGLPLAKQRPRFSKSGRVYTPSETRQYEASLRAIFADGMGGSPPDGESRFALRCFFVRDSRHRIDCDNLIKAVSDAATKTVWVDDSQVLEVVGRLYLAQPNPRAEMLIHRVPDFTRKRVCPECGAGFAISPSASKKYCSEPCRLKNKNVELTCVACQRLFVLPNCQAARRSREGSPRRFCSRSCSKAFWWQNSLTRKRPVGTCANCGASTSKRAYKLCRGCFIAGKAACRSNYWRLTKGAAKGGEEETPA